MPLCGSPACGSSVADLKCARCQAAFYCYATCQKAHWKQHKLYCFPANAVGASVLPSEHAPLQPHSHPLRKVDVELSKIICAFLKEIVGCSKAPPTPLTRVLDRSKALLSRGARPDVLVECDGPVDGKFNTLHLVCMSTCAGLDPLLATLLGADLQPPMDIHAAASVTREGELSCVLDTAITTGQLGMVQLLLDRGADPKRPCLQFAHGLLGYPVRTCVSSLIGPVPFCTGRAALKMLDLLLESGADVNAHDDRSHCGKEPDCVPLFNGIIAGVAYPQAAPALEPLMLRLIERGGDVNLRDAYLRRPIDVAAGLPTLTIFKALAAKGADLRPSAFVASLGDNRCSVHYLQNAVRQNRSDVLEAAAAAGVQLRNVKILINFSAPLLLYAVALGNTDCVRVLLNPAYGVDVNEVFSGVHLDGDRSTFNSTALDALTSNIPEVFRLLVAAGGKTYAQLQQREEEGSKVAPAT